MRRKDKVKRTARERERERETERDREREREIRLEDKMPGARTKEVAESQLLAPEVSRPISQCQQMPSLVSGSGPFFSRNLLAASGKSTTVGSDPNSNSDPKSKELRMKFAPKLLIRQGLYRVCIFYRATKLYVRSLDHGSSRPHTTARDISSYLETLRSLVQPKLAGLLD